MKRFLPLLFLLALVAAGLSRLRFDVEVLNLLPADLPVVQGLRLQQEHFSGAKELILTVEGNDAGVVEDAARSLAEHLRRDSKLVAGAVWQPPWMEQPAQAAELAAFLWLNQPPEVFGALTNRLADATTVLKETRERLATSLSPGEIARLSRDPFGLASLPDGMGDFDALGPGPSFFSSADGTFRTVIVKPKPPLPGYRECAAWLAQVREAVSGWQHASSPQGGLKVRFTGGPAFVAEIAAAMERDMKVSALGTSLVVAALFGLVYRRLRPLVWLLCLLAFTMVVALGLAGLLFGTINVVSLGFAAILLGLSADYAVVLYEESLGRAGQSVAVRRRDAARGIVSAAATTAAAFLTLTLAGLPGLKQLGVLVALGLITGAAIMLKAYLPPLRRSDDGERAAQSREGASPSSSSSAERDPETRTKSRCTLPHAIQGSDFIGWSATALAGLAAVALLVSDPPRVEHSSEPLRPRVSEAYAAMERIAETLHRASDPVWLLATGANEAEVAGRLARSRSALESLAAEGAVTSFTLPDAIWPKPDHQAANRTTLAWLLDHRQELANAALAAGFTTNALELTSRMLDFWTDASREGGTVWPENEVSRWALERFAAGTPRGFVVAGVVNITAGNSQALERLQQRLPAEGVWLAGWNLLGEALLTRVEGRLWLVMVPMCALLVLMLWLTFGRAGETLLCLAVPCAGALCLLAVMKLAGWSWNLMNLAAVPLLLGAGVDYGIHAQLSLRRHGGDLRAVRRTTGRALFVCAATTMAGFGSLAWSNNAGLASLGQVCAAGIGATLLAGAGALPLWWRMLYAGKTSAPEITGPSSLYRGAAWKLGLRLARVLPRGLFDAAAVAIARAYWICRGRRRAVVIENLLPVFNGDFSKAEQAGARLMANFARKLGDLWRFEAGFRAPDAFDAQAGWERFAEANARGKGVLIVTTHLGNWELGAPLLAERGARVLVLSNPEPDDNLTSLRQEARARRGIETLIIGRDPFAFVEVIKRLQDGATVALLIDRPAESSAVTVELFGRAFRASAAAAELARASGCAVVPACIVRCGARYGLRVLPEMTYDRPALGNREARRRFTAEIMRAFEPLIRQHADQWYHFVPLWPGADNAALNRSTG